MIFIIIIFICSSSLHGGGSTAALPLGAAEARGSRQEAEKKGKKNAIKYKTLSKKKKSICRDTRGREKHDRSQRRGRTKQTNSKRKQQTQQETQRSKKKQMRTKDGGKDWLRDEAQGQQNRLRAEEEKTVFAYC